MSNILTYHVISGKVMAADVLKLKSAKTVEGSEVKIDASRGVKIDDSTVTSPDVAADNGVIHVIDTVLIPA
ncbi:beta-Ig-H3/fasciclin [Calothrix sp. PCC 6303]|nr:beta-Ig-H3/fasciclin [Calothrix sp. PCC 6303]